MREADSELDWKLADWLGLEGLAPMGGQQWAVSSMHQYWVEVCLTVSALVWMLGQSAPSARKSVDGLELQECWYTKRLCCHPEGRWQRPVRGPASGEEQPQTPVHTGSQKVGKQLCDKQHRGPGGNEVDHGPAVYSCAKKNIWFNHATRISHLFLSGLIRTLCCLWTHKGKGRGCVWE